MNESPEALEIRKQIKELQRKLHSLPGAPMKHWSTEHVIGKEYEKEFFEVYKKLNRAFTTRECEIITLMLRGLSIKEAAKEMSVTNNAIKFHLTKIYKKIGAKYRAFAMFQISKYLKLEEPISLREDGTLPQIDVPSKPVTPLPSWVLSRGRV